MKTDAFNADLFIAHGACSTLAHDLNEYAAHCNRTRRERDDRDLAATMYDFACRRFIGFLGMFVGPFTGHGC